MKKIVICSVALSALIGFSNCGGGGDSDVRSLTGNTLVDPYVVGAVLFEDKDGDGVQDAGDQVSTETDANGVFSFTNALTVGSILRIVPGSSGTHNGYTFAGELAREVDTVDGYLVVSPFTTLINNGWTEQNIIDVLAEAGLTGIVAEDLKKDPMATFNLTDTVGSIDDEKLARIRASIAIYNLLSVVSELIDDHYALPYTTFVQHPEYQTLLSNMVQQVNAGLSKATMEIIEERIQVAKGQCPYDVADVTIEDIIRGSVAIADYIIPKTVTSCGGPDFACDYNAYTQASTDFAEWKNELGESFYVIRTASNQCTQYAAQHGLLPNVLTKTRCKLEGTNATVVCE